jgi:hypothetical protein
LTAGVLALEESFTYITAGVTVCERKLLQPAFAVLWEAKPLAVPVTARMQLSA